MVKIPDEVSNLARGEDLEEPRHGGEVHEEHDSPGSTLSKVANRLSSEARMGEDPTELFRGDLLTEEVDSLSLIFPSSREISLARCIITSRETIQGK